MKRAVIGLLIACAAILIVGAAGAVSALLEPAPVAPVRVIEIETPGGGADRKQGGRDRKRKSGRKHKRREGGRPTVRQRSPSQRSRSGSATSDGFEPAPATPPGPSPRRTPAAPPPRRPAPADDGDDGGGGDEDGGGGDDG
jgi:hypothetical protein